MSITAFIIHIQIPLNSKCHVKAHCKLYTHQGYVWSGEHTHENTKKFAPKGSWDHSWFLAANVNSDHVQQRLQENTKDKDT